MGKQSKEKQLGSSKMQDFKQFDPKFDNTYVPEKPYEFSELDAKRDEFIQANRSSWIPIPEVPKGIPGLTPLNGRRIPNNRSWYKTVGSFERNGFFNIHTPVFSTKILYFTFFITILWGNFQHVSQGIWTERMHDNYELRRSVYDKINKREIPFSRIWQRPGQKKSRCLLYAAGRALVAIYSFALAYIPFQCTYDF
eukprot:TRINITY_DN1926_c0_g2_i1.p1 TRINITY_DN1926_c0_g2~~TRINITY_DN1926_c0_g2_i1.p1  ORF type:complete len:196 (+),score=47.15 TRINITY_DN1926_c0_g2_i1:138-725(+)